MIDTVFYFAPSKQRYDAVKEKGINARTISFVPDPNSNGKSGFIYKNNVRYTGITEDEALSIIREKYNQAIPFCSKTVAGIIKLGKGLKCVDDSGTVAIDFTGIGEGDEDGINGIEDLIEVIVKRIIKNKDSDLNYAITNFIPTDTGIHITQNNGIDTTVDLTNIVKNISNSQPSNPQEQLNDYAITDFGKSGTSLFIKQNSNDQKSVDISDVVKSSIQNMIVNGDTIFNNVGSVVSVSKILNSGVPIAKITVDGDETTLYSPASSEGGSGTTVIENPYDDSGIKKSIKDLEDRADKTEDDLKGLLEKTDDDIRNDIHKAFNTYEDFINFYLESGDTTPTEFTFGDSNLNEWASRMGLIAPNSDGTYNVGWSVLTQSYNSLAGEVALIKANQSAGGEIDYEALSAGLYSYIDENAATSGMDSTWGKFVKKDDDEIQMLEWMESAIKTYASNEEAYARLLAAAKDYDENGDTIQEGIAKINAFVEKDSNGNYVAGSSLSSMIEAGVNNSLSEVYTENHPDSAVAGLYSRLKTVENEAEGIAGLTTKVDKINDTYVAKADLDAAFTDENGNKVSISAVALKSDVNSAISTLSSSIDGTYARITTAVTKDADGKIDNSVTIDASKVINLASAIDAHNAEITVKKLKAVGVDDSTTSVDSSGIYIKNDTAHRRFTVDLDDGLYYEDDDVPVIEASSSGIYMMNKLLHLDSNGTLHIGNNCEVNADGSGHFGGLTWNSIGLIISIQTEGGGISIGQGGNLSIHDLGGTIKRDSGTGYLYI